jgi:hypothetical protein
MVVAKSPRPAFHARCAPRGGAAAKINNVGAAHIAFLAMCAMNLPSIFAHMQRTHVCATQRNREAKFEFQV